MGVHKKLMTARMRLQGTELKKSGHNKFAGYQYFELGDFLPQINKIFHEEGLCGVVSYTKDYADLTITDTEDGTCLSISSPMVEANLKGAHAIQNLGAVETYQRRYLWMTAMEIVEHDALDSSAPLKDEKQAPVISPRGGIGEDLPQDIKEFLQDLATSVTELVKSGKAVDALAMIDEQELEADQKVYLSNHLESSVRSALKKSKGS
jgi:hypothetical protein